MFAEKDEKRMSELTDGFVQLCRILVEEIDFFGKGPITPPAQKEVKSAIEAAAPFLPLVYREEYVTPLLENLSSVLATTDADTVEALTGVVYDHQSGSEVKVELQRFLAVISNLYRSFLSDSKRASIDIPLASVLPPLAVFQHNGEFGPFTIPSDQISQLFNSEIGIVSLPSTYREHPLLWASLAHETGGHDVTHADAGLLPELAAGVQALFGVNPLRVGASLTDHQIEGLLWSYWIDEAAADVYGLLNIGPAFAVNLAAFFAALNEKAGDGTLPSLRTQSGHGLNDMTLDPHPTDILRLHLAIGVIENLNNLSTRKGEDYIAQLKQLATLCAHKATTIEIQGDIEVERDRWMRVDISRSLEEMQQSARLVGAYIATAKLQSLAGHSIQDIETWDDSDELTAQQIKDSFQKGTSAADLGDDAQLLAGATILLAAQPNLYAQVTRQLNEALDRSYQRDPIWRTSMRHPVYYRKQHFKEASSPELAFAVVKNRQHKK
ncbi:MAG TPA: hypothetical protein VFN35_31225 [Ktedonobacteraceae bacterium]|nr:hypothetical protein [Ktedonobacteraceae bacterium]